MDVVGKYVPVSALRSMSRGFGLKTAFAPNYSRRTYSGRDNDLFEQLWNDVYILESKSVQGNSSLCAGLGARDVHFIGPSWTSTLLYRVLIDQG